MGFQRFNYQYSIIIRALLGRLIFDRSHFSVPVQKFMVLAFSLSLTTSGLAKDPEQQSTKADKYVGIFFSGQDKSHQEILELVQESFYSRVEGFKPIYINTHRLGELALKERVNQDMSCAVSISSDVSKRVLSVRAKIPLFTMNVPRHELDKLRRVYERLGVRVSGIYEEQSLERQVFLAESISPTNKRLAILYNQKDKYYSEPDRAEIKKLGFELDFNILQNTDTPQKYLSKVTDGKGSILLLTNNQSLYTESRVKALVLDANRQKIRLIGNRQVDFEQGALMSIYTPPESLVMETLGEIASFCFNSEDHLPKYADEFTVSLNSNIANAMAENEINAEKLNRKVRDIESQVRSPKTGVIQ